MAIHTLPAIPISEGGRLSEDPQVDKVRFGDGYELRSKQGLNHIRLKRSVPWRSISAAQRNTLRNFFRARAGTEPFNWTLPEETTPRQWVCAKWSSTRQPGDLWHVDADFEEHYG